MSRRHISLLLVSILSGFLVSCQGQATAEPAVLEEPTLEPAATATTIWCAPINVTIASASCPVCNTSTVSGSTVYNGEARFNFEFTTTKVSGCKIVHDNSLIHQPPHIEYAPAGCKNIYMKSSSGDKDARDEVFKETVWVIFEECPKDMIIVGNYVKAEATGGAVTQIATASVDLPCGP
jgi:hypothetical protein